MKTYGVAIVGAGNVAKGHLAAIRATSQAEMVALGTRSLERGGAWTAEQGLDCPIYTELDELLAYDEVDIVVLCTPNHLHAAQTIQAAQAGKHILIEKPVALNLADLRAMQAAVREAGVRTLISFVLRWNPSIRMAKNLITEGAIGEIFMVESCYWHATPRAVPGHWMTRKERAGSVFLMGGCHAVDAARWLAGTDIVEVSAYTARGGKDWFDYPPTAIAMVRFGNGAVGRISATMECVMPYAFDITVMGDRGTMRDNRLYSHLFPGQTDFATIPTVLPDSGAVLDHPFSPGFEHFIECIDKGLETETNLEDAINTHEVCLAVDLSAEEGRSVPLPLSS
ncbi:MAG: Gfo/Idh/MocA family oxidoreductase [Chloroflexota bacterium]|nr:Gfo/Idh/MocA family oxidoreductase [Chloroflexota bacterium]